MSLRVLIVDDDEDVRVLLEVLLQRDALEVVGQAADGREAVEAVERLQPDLVVMDIMMPVMGGVEATRLITSNYPNVGVIGFSAAREESLVRLLQAGAVAVVDKTNMKSLLDVIAAFSPPTG